jgi:CBS domain containing-hemolysin-like protein
VLEPVVALCLIALNGQLALSELAVVSAQKARLKTMADVRRPVPAPRWRWPRSRAAFSRPCRSASPLVGILAGAFSGAALSQSFDEVLEGWGVPTRVAEPLAYVLVIGGLTYLSVIIGELVPKHLALKNPEGSPAQSLPDAHGLATGGSGRVAARRLDQADLPPVRRLDRECRPLSPTRRSAPSWPRPRRRA